MLLIVNTCSLVLRVEVDKNAVVTNAWEIKSGQQRRLSNDTVLLFLMRLCRINQKNGVHSHLSGI